MKKYIAVAVSVVVVLGTLVLGSRAEGKLGDLTRPLSLGFPTQELRIPTLSLPKQESTDPVVVSAWQTFATYREAAGQSDLATVKSLSHQVSPTCADPAKVADCEALMAGLAYFTRSLKFSDFQENYYDEKQVVMLADYETTRVALFFTRDNTGAPKTLGIKWCSETETMSKEEDCVETNPSKRDLDSNGWWDQVEAMFYK